MAKKKALTVTPDLGLPEWTQIGSEAGLDPLGMARPSEVIYQGLLPGISTITIRLRYYSFLPWILHTYISGGHSADPEEFFKFQRNAEAVFALIGMHAPYDGGLAGANWASRLLSSTSSDTINFAESAQGKEGGLLKNKNGALGGIYGPQLQEMGIITSSKEHNIKVPTELGTGLAEAFEETLGSLAPIVKTAISEGKIARTDLDKLHLLKPSEIDVASTEGKLLISVLLGNSDQPLPKDLARRDSLMRLLKFASSSGLKPIDYKARWHWFDTLQNEQKLDPWLAYHMNDLLILAYEALLKGSLEVMRSKQDDTIKINELVDTVLAKSIEDTAEMPFIATMDLTGDEEILADEITNHGEKTKILTNKAIIAAISLIRVILGWASKRKKEVAELFPHNSSFQSLSTELEFIQSLEVEAVKEVISTILIERILKRHLWVASRKFRGQKKYTFLFEPVEGKLRYRNSYKVKLGYPRISQAIQFLDDIKLFDEEKGLSELGRSVLSAA